MEQLACISLPPDNGGIILDVSESGLGFHVVAPVETGEQIRFRLSGRSVAGIDALGEVVWKDETGKSGGLRFTHLPNELAEQVRVWSGQPQLSSPSAQVPAPATEIELAPLITVYPESEKINPLPSIDRNPPLLTASANPYSMFPPAQAAAAGHTEAGSKQSFSSRHTLIVFVLGIVLASVVAVGIFSYVYVHQGGELLIHAVGKIWSGYRPHPIAPTITPPAESVGDTAKKTE
jgi:hypothetical protein